MLQNAVDAFLVIWTRLRSVDEVAARRTLATPSAVAFVVLAIASVSLAMVLLRRPTRTRLVLAAVALSWPMVELATVGGIAGPAIVAAGIAALSLAVGLALGSLLEMDELGLVEGLAIEFALGLGVIGMVTLGLAVVGCLGLGSIVVCGAALAAASGIVLRRRPRVLLDGPAMRPPSTLGLAMTGASALLIEASAVYVVAPELNYDSSYYHLTLARDFAAAAGAPSLPELWTSNIPILPQLVFAVGASLSSVDAAKVIHFVVGIAGVAAMVGVATRLGGYPAGPLAGLLWLASPLVLWEMASAYVDLFLVLWGVAAMLAALLWIDTRRSAYAFAAAAFLGLGFGVKIGMIYVATPLAIALLVRYVRTRSQLRTWSAGAAVCVAVAAPWYVRSYVLTGNPIFPLYNAIFRSPLWEPENPSFNFEGFGMGRGLVDFLLLPWRLTFNTSRFVEAPDGGFGLLPLLVGLAVVLAVIRGRSRDRFVAFVIVIGTFIWFASVDYARYLLAVLGLAAPLVASSFVGLLGVERRPVRLTARLATAALALLALPGFVAMMSNVPGAVPWQVDLGMTDRPSYLRDGFRHYAAYEWVASNLPDVSSARFLGVGLSEWPLAYGPPHEFIGHQTIEGRRVLVARSEDDVMRALEAAGFRYIIVDEFPRPNPGKTAWVVAGDAFAEHHLQLLYANNYVYVYRVAAAAPTRSSVDVSRDPRFETVRTGSSGAWQAFGPSTSSGDCLGVTVTPSGGVLQTFDVSESTLYTIEVRARGATSTTTFVKLQVNWDAPTPAGSTNIEIDSATPVERTYRMSSTSPVGATAGTIFVSGYGEGPVCVTSASVVRVTSP